MAEHEDQSPGRTFNRVSSGADQVVQAHDIQGGIHLYRTHSPSRSAPHQLPADVTHFTGRVAELEKLDSILVEGAATQPAAVIISTIAAAAGMGKTSLAVHWAHKVRERFPDGELYVNLQAFDPGQPISAEQALEGFLWALGVPQETILYAKRSTLETLYRSLVAERKMLVLLDNADSPEQVRPLLPGTPSCLVVVTSRNRLSGLVAHDGAHRISLDLLSRHESVTLIDRIVGSGRVARDPLAAAELARRCAYLPLALRIAAERVTARPHLEISDLVLDLKSARNSLEILAADEDEWTAVRSVFSWSYRVLPNDVARAFRLLASAPGDDFGKDVAAALTNVSVKDVSPLLDALTRVHLLEEIGRNRYRFHDLLREYAIERASMDESPEDQHGAVRRGLLWYLHTAAAANRILRGHGLGVPLAEIDTNVVPLSFASLDEALGWFYWESGNLIAAIRQAAEGDHHAIAWQLPAVLTDLLWRQKWADLVSIFQRALAAARTLGDRTGELWVLSNLGDIHLDLEQLDDAIAEFGQMLTISLDIGDRVYEGWARNGFGHAYLRRRSWRQAIEYLNAAVNIFDEVQNGAAQANALANLGDALRGAHRYDEAIKCCELSLLTTGEPGNRSRELSLPTTEESGNRSREPIALRVMGWIYIDLHRFEDALSCLQDALVIDQEFGNRYDEGRTQHSIGDAYHRDGKPEQARAAWLAALAAFEELGSPQATEVRALLDALPLPDGC
jgi:tetratricopeptide (TPR) repeat protein